MTISAPVADEAAAVRTVELTVSGMTCAACSARVERTLNKLDGVRASVNYATEPATVQVPEALDDGVLIERVRTPGYTAEIRGEEDPDTGFARVRDLRHRSSSMDTLVSLGVLASFAWSAWAAFGGGAEPGYWIGFGPTAAGADAIYLDVAAGVTTFLLAGRYFESRSRR